MLFYQGIASLFQVTLLPGLILTALLDIRPMLRRVVLSFALSLVVTYVFVLTTTALGVYRQPVVYGFFVVELAMLVVVSIPSLMGRLSKIFEARRQRPDASRSAQAQPTRQTDEPGSPAYETSLFLAALTLLAVAALFFVHFGEVFTMWDAAVSWDRWSLDWFANHLPVGTNHYPQLIPANWSITYQFLGTTDVKQFAKGMMWLFEVATLSLFFDLGISTKRIAYFWGMIAAACLLLAIGSDGSGYVDTPVAFFAFLSFVCLLYAHDSLTPARTQVYIFLGAFFAAAAAVTKQAGLFSVCLYPVLYAVILEPKSHPDKRASRLTAGLSLLAALALAGSWYVYKEIDILAGRDASEVAYVTLGIYRGLNVFLRAQQAFYLLTYNLTVGSLPGSVVLAVFAILIIHGARFHLYRMVTWLVIIPYGLIWLIFFGYDPRNLCLALPFVGLVAGGAIENPSLLVGSFRELFALFGRNLVYVVGVAAVLLILAGLRNSDQDLRDRSIAQQRTIGDSDLDSWLYQYAHAHPLHGKILTNYSPLGYLPDLKSYNVYVTNDNFIGGLQDPAITYELIVKEGVEMNQYNAIETAVHNHSITLLFEDQGYLFVELKKPD